MKGKIFIFFIFTISIIISIFTIDSLRVDYVERQHFKRIEDLINYKTEEEKDKERLKKSKTKCDIINEEYDKVFNRGKLNEKNFHSLQIGEHFGEISFLVEEEDRYYTELLTIEQIKDIKDIIFERKYE